MADAVSLAQTLATFDDPWSPRIVAACNGNDVRVAKARGEVVWHSHPGTDDLFLVLAGPLAIETRDRTVRLGPGEPLVVPRGPERRPVAEEERHLLPTEPRGTPNAADSGTAAEKRHA